jgi:hypothetical protein
MATMSELTEVNLASIKKGEGGFYGYSCSQSYAPAGGVVYLGEHWGREPKWVRCSDIEIKEGQLVYDHTLDAFRGISVAYISPLEPTHEEKVKKLRTQMLLHSYLYYTCDAPQVSDHQWQDWADELTILQMFDDEIFFYDEEFEDWNEDTGCHLPAPDFIKEMAWKLFKVKSR